MTANTASSARFIYLAASKLPDESSRLAFLDDACGEDHELREKVDKLLASQFLQNENPLQAAIDDLHVQQDSKQNEYCETSLSNEAGHDELHQLVSKERHVESAGTQIGPYKIREQLGEGGMGVVYVAEQTEPVRRKVALKIIKPGMDSKEVIARFEAERQALAMMSHSNIAKVLDGGTTDEGRPYFVMELVKGIRITQFCDEQKLSMRERLELFTTVCQAVQHAHHKGIIHRDLKPSNVLVELHDVAPVPKVIDFGIAKATNQQLTLQTVYTQFAQLVGTPLYMSPEQAQLSGLDVDTRSDVYSLGVMLYELLAGMTPFDESTLSSVGLDEMRRIIREDDPPRPSYKVSTLEQEQVSTISVKRRIDPRQLSVSMKRELDWIVMKALEKDRTRRYESASDLAEDIQRYLDDETVRACPPSVGYKLKKYAKRHKGLLTTLTLMAATLLIATVVSVSYAIQADEAKGKAIAAEQNAKEEAEISKAVNEFLNEDLLAQANPANQPNPNVKLKAVIDQAAEKLENRFTDQPLVEAAIRQTLAETYNSLGDYQKAKLHVDRAFELRSEHLEENDPDTLASALFSAWVLNNLGSFKASMEKMDTLQSRIHNALGKNHPLAIKATRYLVRAQINMGLYREAELLARELVELTNQTLGEHDAITLKAENTLAVVLIRAGKYQEAEKLIRKTVEKSRKKLGEEHPSTLSYLGKLAIILKGLAEYDEAERIYNDVLQIRLRILGENHPNTLSSMQNLSGLYSSIGKLKKAEELDQKVLEKSRQILGDDHPSTLARMHNLASSHKNQNRFELAEELYSETLTAARRTLGHNHPQTIQTKLALALLYQRLGRYPETEKLLRDVIQIVTESLGGDHPFVEEAIRLTALMKADLGNYAEAEELFNSALEKKIGRLGDQHPFTLSYMNDLANLYDDQGRYAEAKERHQRVLETRIEKLGKHHPHSLHSLHNLSNVEYSLGHYEQAEKLALETLQLEREVFGEANPETHNTLTHLSRIYSAQKRYEEAAQISEQLLKIVVDTWGEDHPGTLTVMHNLAVIYLDLNRLTEAEQVLEKVLNRRQKIFGDEHPSTLMTLSNMAILNEKQKRYDASEEILTELVDTHVRVLGAGHPETLRVTFNLGATYLIQKKYQAAEPLIKNSYESLLDKFGASHPNVSRVEQSYVFVLKQLGNHDKAASVQKRRIEVNQEEFGVESQEAIDARDDLAIIYREADQLDDWERTVRKNLKLKLRVLGEEHKDTNYSRGELRSVMLRKGQQAAERDDWPNVCEAMTPLTQIRPHFEYYVALLPAFLLAGDETSYRDVCQEAWEKFHHVEKEKSKYQQSGTVILCALSPESGIDSQQMVTVAADVLSLNPSNTQGQLAHGVALYRSGRFAEAVEAFPSVSGVWTQPLAAFMRAMSMYEAGRVDEAEMEYRRAVQLMADIAPSPTAGMKVQGGPERWVLHALCRVLLNEAEALIGIPADTVQILPPAPPLPL